MIDKRDKLFKQFEAFRGTKVAKKEKGYFEIVVKFNQYMDDYSAHPIPLPDLKDDIITSEDISKKLGDGGYNRVLGAMAAIKFSIDDAIEVLSGPKDSPLKQKLASLRDLLASMYNKPLTNTNSNKQLLLSLMDELLKIDVQNSNDALIMKDICMRAFVLLSSVYRSLSKLTNLKRGLVTAKTGLNVDSVLKDIELQLKNVEAKIAQLEQLQAKKMSAEVQVVEVVRQSDPKGGIEIEKQQAAPVKITVKEQAVAIIREKAGDRIDLNQLAANLGALKTDVASVLRLKLEQSRLIDDIRTLEVLSRDLALNKQKIKGRLYVYQLVEQHGDALKILDTLSQKDPNFHTINENLFKITHPSVSRYIVSGGLWVLSSIGSLGNMAFRAGAPKKVQDKVEAIAPETLDSQSKKLLEKVVMDRLLELNQRLVQVQQELPQISHNPEMVSVEFHSLVLAQPTGQLLQQDSVLDFLLAKVQSAAEIERNYMKLTESAQRRVVEDPQIGHPLQLSLPDEMKAIYLEILVQDRKSEDQKLHELQIKLQLLALSLEALVAKRKDMEAKNNECKQELGKFKANLFDNFNVEFLTKGNELLDDKLKAAKLADEAYAKELADFEKSFPKLKNLTQQETVEHLEQAIEANSLVQKAVDSYVDVRKDIKIFAELNSSKKEMTDFIQKNAVISTYIWNFLVELCTGNKSAMVRMIEDAQQLNSQIDQFKDELQQNKVQANNLIKAHFPSLELPVEVSRPSEDKPKQESPGTVTKVSSKQILEKSKLFLSKIKGESREGSPSPDKNSLNTH